VQQPLFEVACPCMEKWMETRIVYSPTLACLLVYT
jgi:hypothetical protein